MLNNIETFQNEFKIKIVDDLKETVIASFNIKECKNIYIEVNHKGER